jgi:hypothetical protein
MASNALCDRLADARARLDAGAHLDKGDLAVLLNITTRTVDRWVKDGLLPPADMTVNARTVRWFARSVRPAIDEGKFGGGQ